jgi:hypothetical protein
MACVTDNYNYTTIHNSFKPSSMYIRIHIYFAAFACHALLSNDEPENIKFHHVRYRQVPEKCTFIGTNNKKIVHIMVDCARYEDERVISLHLQSYYAIIRTGLMCDRLVLCPKLCFFDNV